MWGPPTSGKTTFLAALSVALLRRRTTWRLVGEDEASTEKLIDLTMGLTQARTFPPATVGIEGYRWALEGRVSRITRQRPFGRRLREQDVRISLDLVDTPGELAGPNHHNRAMRADLIETLAHSEAIVLLYDPIREFAYGDAFDHTFGVLSQMSQRMLENPGGRLPHHVAVCITKFDEIRVLATAEKLGLIQYDLDAPGFPRVADEDAREAFEQFCLVSRIGNAEMVPRLLEQKFRPDRIKYFVTSAIGFYVDPRAGVFNPDDYQNHLPDSTEQPGARIRGAIYPINVVEPLLWLSQRLTKES
jgi:hypothetical protein